MKPKLFWKNTKNFLWNWSSFKFVTKIIVDSVDTRPEYAALTLRGECPIVDAELPVGAVF